MANEPQTAKFLKLLSDEKLTLKDFPSDIQAKIKGYNMSLGRYKTKPSDEFLTKLQAMDTEICDKVNAWLSEQTDAETADEKKERERKEKEASDKIIADQKEADRLEKERVKAEKEQKEKEDLEAAQAAEKEKNKGKADGKEAAVEIELLNLSKSDKNSLSLSELKKSAPSTYELIWDGYKEGEENGIETNRFSLMETEKETFTLTKK